ncbi:MAG: amidase, partial [Alphaproteobacteria bacterium]
ADIRARLGDALIAMPTTPLVAPEIAPLEADDAVFHRTNLRTLRNTTLGNFLDLPGLAIPNGSDADGLPTSFLLCVQSGEDERLLGVGLAVEPLIRPG